MSQADDGGQHFWKRAAKEASQATAEMLIAIPDDYPRYRTLLVSEDHEYLHKYLFEYYRTFEPKHDELGGDVEPEDDEYGETLWTEELLTVEVPERTAHVRLDAEQAAVMRSQQSDREVLSAIYEQLPTQPVTVRLDGLREFWQVNNVATIGVSGWVENQGQITRTLNPSYHLPVAACIAVRSQLDNCLEDIGWLPEVESTPRTEIDEELIEEWEEWRQRNV